MAGNIRPEGQLNRSMPDSFGLCAQAHRAGGHPSVGSDGGAAITRENATVKVNHSSGHEQSSDRWEDEGGLVKPARPPPVAAHAERSEPVESLAELALMDALPMGVLMTCPDGRIVYSNPACQALYGRSAASLLGSHWLDGVGLGDRASVADHATLVADSACPLSVEFRLPRGDGQILSVRHRVVAMDPGQQSRGRIHMIEDISAVKAFEQRIKSSKEALSRERERARVTLESIGDAVISTDSAGRITYLNAVAEGLTGWTREAACGVPFGEVFRVIDADTGEVICNPAEQAMRSGNIGEIPANCLLRRRDGSELAIEDSSAPILDAEGRLTGAVVVFRDRKMSHENMNRMTYLARHDLLTGLCNRLTFGEHFDQAIKLARRHANRMAVLFIDLDNFKQVNDRLGHAAGDQLLKNLSLKLRDCVRSTDLVCRHGGDEFLVLLSEISRPDDAARIARKIHAAMAAPIDVDDDSVTLELSIGISLYPDHGHDRAALIQRADAAMYQAKLEGGRHHCFFRPGMKRWHQNSDPRRQAGPVFGVSPQSE